MKPDLEAAIRAVQALADRRASATRHDARPILLAIGGSLLAGKPEELGDAVDRLQRLPEPLRETWGAAVRDEWSMAFTEYVRSVDPRYLEHPRYDLAYTLEARLQLEAREKACAYLRQPVDDASKQAVARADALLRAHTGTNVLEWVSKRASDATR